MKGFLLFSVFPCCLSLCFWLLVCNPVNAAGKPDSHSMNDAMQADGRRMETKIDFTGEEYAKAASLVAAHMRDARGWRNEDFVVKPYEYARRSGSESHLFKLVAEHIDDKKPQGPGGGKSLLVIVDMDAMEIVRVLAFQ